MFLETADSKLILTGLGDLAELSKLFMERRIVPFNPPANQIRRSFLYVEQHQCRPPKSTFADEGRYL